MKKIVFLLAALGTMMSCGQDKTQQTKTTEKVEQTEKKTEGIQWMTMNEALAAQKKQPKKILVHFFAKWCPMCKRMEGDTYKNAEIVKYINENYYAVSFDSEGGESVDYQGKTYGNPTYNPNAEVKYGGGGSVNEFSRLMGIRGYPTMVLFDENAQPITHFSGYIKPREVEPYLAVIATDAYKNIASKEQWEEYIQKFEHKVK